MSISVIMTCHNEERYIEQAIRSVVSQTAYDLIDEIIVVNDGSSDGSQVLLESLAADIGKLHIILAGGVGLPAARNLALQVAKGKFIALLDGDDYWTSEKIELQLPALTCSPDIGLVYSDFYDFTQPDASDAMLIAVRRYHAANNKTLATYFVNDAPIVPSTVIIKREVFDDVGFFDEKFRLGEDTEMFLRIAEKWQFEHVNAGLLFKRRHGKNLTARLEKLLPVANELTDRFVIRNPELAPLARKRMARRYASVGNDCMKHGERLKAIGYLSRALILDPLYWSIYAYFALALVPVRVGLFLRRARMCALPSSPL